MFKRIVFGLAGIILFLVLGIGLYKDGNYALFGLCMFFVGTQTNGLLIKTNRIFNKANQKTR